MIRPLNTGTDSKGSLGTTALVRVSHYPAKTNTRLYKGKAQHEVMSHAVLYRNHEHKQLRFNFTAVSF